MKRSFPSIDADVSVGGSVGDWMKKTKRKRQWFHGSTRSRSGKSKWVSNENPVMFTFGHVVNAAVHTKTGTSRQARHQVLLRRNPNAPGAKLIAPHDPNGDSDIFVDDLCMTMTGDDYDNNFGDNAQEITIFSTGAGLMSQDEEFMRFVGVAQGEVVTAKDGNGVAVVTRGSRTIANNSDYDIRSGDLIAWGIPRLTSDKKGSAQVRKGHKPGHCPMSTFPVKYITGGSGCLLTDLVDTYMGRETYRIRKDNPVSEEGSTLVGVITAFRQMCLPIANGDRLFTDEHNRMLPVDSKYHQTDNESKAAEILELFERVSGIRSDYIRGMYKALLDTKLTTYDTPAIQAAWASAGVISANNQALLLVKIEKKALQEMYMVCDQYLVRELNTLSSSRIIGQAWSDAKPGQYFDCCLGVK